MIDNYTLALLDAYKKSNDLFHEKITPNLPDHIKSELEQCETFTCYFESKDKDKKVIISVNEKKFDITQWWIPGITIFDVYEYPAN